MSSDSQPTPLGYTPCLFAAGAWLGNFVGQWLPDVLQGLANIGVFLAGLAAIGPVVVAIYDRVKAAKEGKSKVVEFRKRPYGAVPSKPGEHDDDWGDPGKVD